MINLTAKLKESHFDYVHNSQAVFRGLMMGLAFPGKIEQLQTINLAANRYNYVLQCMLCLLDLETTFALITPNREEHSFIAKYLEINTGSCESRLDKADFVLCLTGVAKNGFSRLKQGSLEHPDHSATIFYHVNSICDQPKGDHQKIVLAGPGIKTERIVYISGVGSEELSAWKQHRGNYPLGADIYCVSTQGQLIGIPRSVDIVSINE